MSKILYRPHRGGLTDAMTDLHEFDSISEMLEYVYKNESFGDEESIKDITYEKYGTFSRDFRIGWNGTYIICSKGRGGCGWFTTNLSKEESLKAYKEFLNRG